ncbi:sigma-70 family RNA polymerase sigma factor [Actinoallomurus sp. NPDC052308]|uniref:RNA polymerase sigma factor n=1 Tax=Actinoallomurus sp. NPDC052308 TaxID=3155530 RepID=UPI00341C034F
MEDPDALVWFTELFEAYFERVYAYAVTRVGGGLAEEVASETFNVAWRRREAVPEDALPWLLGVARNVARNQFRAQARHESLAAELRSWTTRSELICEDVGDAVADRDVLLRGLASLNETDREVLALTAWQGLPAGEAASVLGCTKATFYMRLHRARKHLEQAVAKAEQDTIGILDASEESTS